MNVAQKDVGWARQAAMNLMRRLSPLRSTVTKDRPEFIHYVRAGGGWLACHLLESYLSLPKPMGSGPF